eukprot:5090299-Amphidinium_carterae.1
MAVVLLAFALQDGPQDQKVDAPPLAGTCMLDWPLPCTTQHPAAHCPSVTARCVTPPEGRAHS